jgi:hypothetical protein
MKYCPNCGKVGIEGMEFCPRCGQRLTGFDSKEKQGYVHWPEVPLTERNWFERHLNWTMVLACAGAYAVNFIIHISYGDSIGIGYLIIYMAILALVWGWTLTKKNRSLWWLPLGLFVPFGFIVLFCLENKSLSHDASGYSVAEIQ